MSGGRLLHTEGGLEAWIEEVNHKLAALERSLQIPFTDVKTISSSNTGGETPTSVTTTESTLVTTTIVKPPWANSVSVLASGGLTLFGLSLPGVDDVTAKVRIAGNDGIESRVRVEGGYYHFIGAGHTRDFSPGSSVSINLRAQVSELDGINIEASAFYITAIAVFS